MFDKIMDVLFATIVLGVVLVFAGLLIAIPITLLWNSVMPHIFGLPSIDYFQGLWLWLLSSFLIKSTTSATVQKPS